MVSRQIVFALVTFFHDFFTAVWIGGLVVLGTTVLPSAVKVFGKGPETKKLMDAIQKRLSVFIYVSIVGLWVTGLLLSQRAPGFQGLFHFGTPYATVLSLKHILVLLMVAVTVIRSLVLGRLSGQPAAQVEKLKMALLFLNMALGVLVLLLSGFSAALAGGLPAG
ncbi:MAG: hypothetical protein JXD18_12580 [Anaerolineae bacterium]|nr:hypothetical protein [Anaerolineae bacterium]